MFKPGLGASRTDAGKFNVHGRGPSLIFRSRFGFTTFRALYLAETALAFTIAAVRRGGKTGPQPATSISIAPASNHPFNEMEPWCQIRFV